MNSYVVLYRVESVMAPADPPFGFLCQADDPDHAEEQCVNAYPDCDVVWISVTETYETALKDYWGIDYERE